MTGLLATLLGLGCAVEVPMPAQNAQPNILLVSVDTLRADHTTPYGYTRDTTPVLAKLSREGTRFNAAFSQANESAWSHAALLTGRYASELAAPVYATYAIPESATLVSEALSAYGYATAGFSAGGHVTADFGYDQGWDRWSAEPGFASFFDTGPKASEWIAQLPADKPWFVFLHGYDAHRPYSRPGPWDHLYAGGEGSRLAEALCKNPCISEMVLGDALLPEVVPSWFTHSGGDSILDPETYTRLAAAASDSARVAITPADRQHVLDHYDGAVRYADTQLGLTLTRLEASGDLDNTVVIVLSDHGEYLGEHSLVEHAKDVYEPVLHVPFMAKGPGFLPGRDPAPIQGHDLAWMVLDAAGLDSTGLEHTGSLQVADLYYTLKKDLMAPYGKRFDRIRRAFRVGSQKYITGSDGTRELYDLAADPAERRPLVDVPPELAAAELAWLAAHPEVELVPASEGGALGPDEEALKALGYAE